MPLFTRLSAEDLETEITGTLTPEDVADHTEAHEDVASEMEEIQGAFTAIDDAEEVKQNLEEKVVALEALATIELTAYHVNDAKKTYTDACKRLGLDPVAISTEDIDNGVKLSVEGIKEIITKIVEAIKAIIAKIVLAVKKLYIKIQVAFNNDKKVATKLMNEIEEKAKKYNTKDDMIVDLKAVFQSNNNLSNSLYKSVSGLTVLYKGEKPFSDIIGYALQDYNKDSGRVFKLTGVNADGSVTFAGNFVDGSVGDENVTPSWLEKITGQKLTHGIYGEAIDVKILSTKANTIYAALKYEHEESYHLDYKALTVKGILGGDKVPSAHDYNIVNFKILPKVDLSDIKWIGKLVGDLSGNIGKQYSAMLETLKTIDSDVARAEKDLANLGDDKADDVAGNVKQSLSLLKELSTIIPRAHVDRMSAILYLNKACIKLLAAANRGLKG
jgi:hypothetical protein